MAITDVGWWVILECWRARACVVNRIIDKRTQTITRIISLIDRKRLSTKTEIISDLDSPRKNAFTSARKDRIIKSISRWTCASVIIRVEIKWSYTFTSCSSIIISERVKTFASFCSLVVNERSYAFASRISGVEEKWSWALALSIDRIYLKRQNTRTCVIVLIVSLVWWANTLISVWV